LFGQLGFVLNFGSGTTLDVENDDSVRTRDLRGSFHRRPDPGGDILLGLQLNMETHLRFQRRIELVFPEKRSEARASSA
jgi:hypothetical protein